ncbi:DUF4038 domain-containing protein [Paenibacillus psychroresistens]|uniref:DUF4038 domain-containing protein n=1 Tax=Paenibacillus psychroresistens TaxID=1778678 RepID=A0A6B8RHZ2_9BACL|nr:DUF4038 domain-containing protein [Paenibacillus psychroresistens]QGQ94996.1 DUF4038 domain-containing protein [Paenibacillus psychroresistens]
MSKVSVSANKQYLIKDGKPFFYLADTVWSVFSNTTLEEWETYLNYRKMQNYNTLQISILPLFHDASSTYTGEYPFEMDEEGIWNFYQPNKLFFEKAEKMVSMAYDKGFVLTLVILWNNFVPGAWANRIASAYTMPKAAVKAFTEFAVKLFTPYDPIYFVSGDTSFESEEIIDYYQIVLDTVKSVVPEALTALHVVGNYHVLPQQFIDSEKLDLYIYQSGHNLEDQHLNYGLAEAFLSKTVQRPIINSEPCYEGHGHGSRYGRFGAFDLRKAFWWSTLSGASAGFTYGAHGIWSWHKAGAEFNNAGWSKVPLDWQSALRLQGAWDVGYSAWLFQQYELFALKPAQHLLITPYPEIRVAASEGLDKIAVYIPYNNEVQLDLDMSEYDFVFIELEKRNILKLDISVEAGVTTIAMSDFNADVVVIANKITS